MPRPPKPRMVCQAPGALYFKPRGIPLVELEEVVLHLDETEALRLADLEGCTQEQVGERMQVSRATVGRILESARRKVAEALVLGKALRISEGAVPQNESEAVPMRHGGGRGHGRRRGNRGR
jgi:predicted DNA-binding protein (UPF0251 family)